VGVFDGLTVRVDSIEGNKVVCISIERNGCKLLAISLIFSFALFEPSLHLYKYNA